MKNLQFTLPPTLPIALGFTPAKKTIKPVPPVYYIDECQVDGDLISVDYTIDDNWSSAIIKSADLRKFVLTDGLNEYCFDNCVNGEHVQDSGSFDPDTFIAENLYELVGTYLKAKKVWQVVS